MAHEHHVSHYLPFTTFLGSDKISILQTENLGQNKIKMISVSKRTQNGPNTLCLCLTSAITRHTKMISHHKITVSISYTFFLI